jgi:hypothetical protein
MGLFERKITAESNLSSIPTDRLLREHAAASQAWSAFVEAQARSEFTHTIDGDTMVRGIQGAALRAHIAEELERRGLTPG